MAKKKTAKEIKEEPLEKQLWKAADNRRTRELSPEDISQIANTYRNWRTGEDDFNFAERFAALRAEFEAQLEDEARLNKAIQENLAKVRMPQAEGRK